MTTPLPVAAPGVEAKVKVATIGAYLGGVIGMLVVQALSDGTLLAMLPAPYATLLAPLVPAAVAFVASWLTKHTPRASGLGDAVDADIEAKAKAAVDEAVKRAQVAVSRSDDNSNAPVHTDGEVHS